MLCLRVGVLLGVVLMERVIVLVGVGMLLGVHSVGDCYCIGVKRGNLKCLTNLICSCPVVMSNVS